MYQIFSVGELVAVKETVSDVREYFEMTREDYLQDARENPECYADTPDFGFDEYVHDAYEVLALANLDYFL